MILRTFSLIAVCASIVAAEGAARKVTQTEALSAATVKVQPEYPQLARQLKIAGTVELDVVIGETGAVETVTPVSGNPVLTKPAADAVKRWKFKPFQQDGAAVKAEAVLKISFAN
jgi:protein TonB